MVTLAVLALCCSGAAAASAEDELRVLAIRLTWGPTGVSEAHVRDTVTEADAFYRRSSFGRVGLTADVTPLVSGFVVPRECFGDGGDGGLGLLAQRAREAAVALGYDTAVYDRFIYVFPAAVCGFGGLGSGPDVLLAGPVDWRTMVHEFTHTFQLPHAGSAECPSCTIAEYGDPLSIMGGGGTDFGAWEKHKLGWLAGVERARNAGTFVVGAVDLPSVEPQAVALPTRFGELWVEHRTSPEPLVIARIVRRPHRGTVPRAVYLTRGRTSLAIPGLLRVRRLAAQGSTARLELVWLDRKPPSKPRLTAAIAGEPTVVRWRPAVDTASGVAAYRVLVDGRLAVTVRGRWALVSGLAAGAHRIAVRAVDRAGNVGQPATALLRVPRQR